MTIRPTRRFLTRGLPAALAVLVVVALVAVAATRADDDAPPRASGRGGDASDPAPDTTARPRSAGSGGTRNGNDGVAATTRPFIALLCRFADKPATFGITPERIQETLVGPGRSVDGYVREMSLGQASIAGSRAAGWFALPKTMAEYGTDVAAAYPIAQDCAAAAATGGVDLAPYQDVIVYLNDQLPGAEGVTQATEIQVGGAPRVVTTVLLTWRGLTSPPLLLHELGHVFGGRHPGGTPATATPCGGSPPIARRPTPAAPSSTRSPASPSPAPTARCW